MKIALVHDYLAQDGGAERVLLFLHRMWPDAPIFTLFHNPGSVRGFEHADIRESYIARLPWGRKKYQWYLPIMPQAFESFDFSSFDVVISSTSAFAKGIITPPGTLHICYCHTPTRYLWTDTQEYIADLKYPKIVKMALPRLLHRLRVVDQLAADRVDVFVANSETVQERIRKYYHKESEVIYPPVETTSGVVASPLDDYFISGGRIVPYKRFDVIVEAFNRLQCKLIIFGDGPALPALQKRAKSNITFVGRVDDPEKIRLLSRAQAFIHPQVEDFGITAVESMACGRPVLAYAKGGASETVIPGVTGALFHTQSWNAVFEAVTQFDPSAWNPEAIRAAATRFDVSVFETRMKELVSQKVADAK
jgi:glycosyltransferase involved in cell wall biosynthesis